MNEIKGGKVMIALSAMAHQHVLNFTYHLKMET